MHNHYTHAVKAITLASLELAPNMFGAGSKLKFGVSSIAS